MQKVITISDTGHTNAYQKTIFNETEHEELNKILDSGYHIQSVVAREKSVTYILSNNDHDSRPTINNQS